MFSMIYTSYFTTADLMNYGSFSLPIRQLREPAPKDEYIGKTSSQSSLDRGRGSYQFVVLTLPNRDYRYKNKKGLNKN